MYYFLVLNGGCCCLGNERDWEYERSSGERNLLNYEEVTVGVGVGVVTGVDQMF